MWRISLLSTAHWSFQELCLKTMEHSRARQPMLQERQQSRVKSLFSVSQEAGWLRGFQLLCPWKFSSSDKNYLSAIDLSRLKHANCQQEHWKTKRLTFSRLGGLPGPSSFSRLHWNIEIHKRHKKSFSCLLCMPMFQCSRPMMYGPDGLSIY